MISTETPGHALPVSDDLSPEAPHGKQTERSPVPTSMEDVTEFLRAQLPCIQHITDHTIREAQNASYGDRIALEKVSGRAADLLVAIRSLR